MLALSLVDDNPTYPVPWAMLMEAKLKTIETRKWYWPMKTHELPVDLLLCATASSRTSNRAKAVCVVRVFANHVFDLQHQEAACCPLYPGFGFHTDNLRWLSEKFYVKGAQGFFKVDIPKHVQLYTPTDTQIQEKRAELIQLYPNYFRANGKFNWQKLAVNY